MRMHLPPLMTITPGIGFFQPRRVRIPKEPQRYLKDPHNQVVCGQSVERGQILVTSDLFDIHASLAGIVTKINEHFVEINGHSEELSHRNSHILAPLDREFAKTFGLVGMGGACFPAVLKHRSLPRGAILVINCVECEPYVTIDHALLAQEWSLIEAGVTALCDHAQISDVVLAVHEKDRIPHPTSWRIIRMPQHYPAGAERLILQSITGRYPLASRRPSDAGFLVHNLSSIWAIGNAFVNSVPLIDRPMSVIFLGNKSACHNVFVPTGTSVVEVIESYRPDIINNLGTKFLIMGGGLMMGTCMNPTDVVHKGLNAIFIVPQELLPLHTEKPCINCGACHEVCPLGLHPSLMSAALHRSQPLGSTFQILLQECFLCGACSYVCPARIPLAHIFQQSKSGARKQ